MRTSSATSEGQRRRLAIALVTLLTLGSGLVNVYSVIGPLSPERIDVLRRLFPLEFVHFTRSAALLCGFALVTSSLNIYRRKRLAWWIVTALAAFSIAFHIVKGLDYQEAVFSAGLLAALWATRREFTVCSRGIHWTDALKRAFIALVLALGYGAAGFWLLEPREFGRNFDWLQAIRNALEFLSLQGDPSLVPHTGYARWFVESLNLMTVSALLYSGYAIFRPVIYRFRTHPADVERARRILAKYGRSAHDFFKARPDKSFFFSRNSAGFLAYRVSGSFAVVLGDPVGPDEQIRELVSDFAKYCRDNGWSLGFHHVMPDFLGVYQELGFARLKVGDEAIVDLKEFSLQAKSARSFRAKVNHLESHGISAIYYSPPIAAALMEELKGVSSEWLQTPGRRERQFGLGMFDEGYISATPVFAVVDACRRVLAFVNVVPSYRKDEATVDLMRRRTDAPNGIMDYLFVKLFLRNKEQGFERFNLGMAPMTGFQPYEEASPEERAIHVFMQHLNFLFSFKGLLAYKAKFATSWEPRYAVYRTPPDLLRLAFALNRVSEVEIPGGCPREYRSGRMGFQLHRGYAGLMKRAPVLKFVNRLQAIAWGPRQAQALSVSEVTAADAPKALAVMREGPGREVLRTMLTDPKWAIVFAGTPAEAIARHREDPFPVILYERELTGCDWRLVVRLFAKLSPSPSVILLSPNVDRNLWDEVVRCGGCEILRMPPDRDALMRTVRAAWSLWRNQNNLRQPITPLRTA